MKITIVLSPVSVSGSTPEIASYGIAITTAADPATVVATGSAPAADGPQTSITMADMAPGDYVVTAQALAADSTAIGAPANQAFTEPALVQRLLPTSITVTFG